MSCKGDCWDNAVTETLFGSLKVERLHDMRFETRRLAMDQAAGSPSTTITAAIRRWAIKSPCRRKDMACQPNQHGSIVATPGGTLDEGKVKARWDARGEQVRQPTAVGRFGSTRVAPSPKPFAGQRG
jgi:hypothetical protein